MRIYIFEKIIFCLVCIPSNFVLAEFNEQTTKKIAFVKQVTHPDLYCASRNAQKDEIVFSSAFRAGPVALFSKLNADFYIVESEQDAECQIWKEQAIDCKFFTLEELESLRSRIHIPGHQYPQGYYMVKCADIDWDRYDIVISINISIPSKITTQHPRVLWAYYIYEGCQPSYPKSLQAPIVGYDVFLTQNFCKNPQLPAHAIEFPLALQYYGCYHELLGLNDDVDKRTGINIETQTNNLLTDQERQALNAMMPAFKACGNIKTMIQTHMQTKYFVQYLVPRDGKRYFIRGNGAVEAVAAGNLLLSNGFGSTNPGLLTPNTTVCGFQELLDKIKYFENNPDAYKKELELQRKNLNELCFERPINEIFKKHTEKLRRLTRPQ